MAEARHSDRARALLGAQIHLNNRTSTVECQVRNISAKGAKLVVADTISVPEEFELNIPQKGRVYFARVIWRTAKETGIEFCDPAGSAGVAAVAGAAPDEVYRRVRALEAENAALKQKISELHFKIQQRSESI